MSLSSSLLYPACYLKYRSAAAASLFLDEVFVLAPSEDSLDVLEQEKVIDSLNITPILVSPLGEKLEDFKNGLKALEAWGEQLGLGGNTGFETLYAALKNTDNEDIQGIIGAIKGGSPENLLTASRFFLRLSIEADKRTDLLDQELEKVEMDGSKISDLVEGLESSWDASAGRKTYFIEPLNRPRERLRAWARTFFAGNRVEHCWPLGESVAIKDLMDSAYESLSGGSACVEAASFPIPLHPAKLCSREASAGIRPLFARLMALLSGKPGQDAAQFVKSEEMADLVRDIKEIMDANCTSGTMEGGARMVVSIYPDHSWQEVLLKATGLKDIQADQCPLDTVYGSLFLV